MCRYACAVLSLLVGHAAVAQTGFEQTPYWNADLRKNIFPQGDFVKLDQRGVPSGWDDVSAFVDGSAKIKNPKVGIVHLQGERGETHGFDTTIEIPPAAKRLTFVVRMRGLSIKQGRAKGTGAGVLVAMVSDDGEERGLPRIDVSYAGYRSWKATYSTVRVLPGDSQVKIRVEVVDAQGKLELDQIMVIPSEPGFQATAQQLFELTNAIRNDDDVAIRKLIDAQPELLEYRSGTEDNGTPLARAAWFDSAKVAQELIRLGADLEAPNASWGNTPLEWSCWWGNLRVATVLINAGANIADCDKKALSAKSSNAHARGKPSDFEMIAKLVRQKQQETEKE